MPPGRSFSRSSSAVVMQGVTRRSPPSTPTGRVAVGPDVPLIVTHGLWLPDRSFARRRCNLMHASSTADVSRQAVAQVSSARSGFCRPPKVSIRPLRRVRVRAPSCPPISSPPPPSLPFPPSLPPLPPSFPAPFHPLYHERQQESESCASCGGAEASAMWPACPLYLRLQAINLTDTSLQGPC